MESGTVTLSGGTLVVDGIVITRSCGSFQQAEDLVIGGVTNIVTALPFSITSITSDEDIIFLSNGSRRAETTNFVQATNRNPDGGYNTNFVDITANSHRRPWHEPVYRHRRSHEYAGALLSRSALPMWQPILEARIYWTYGLGAGLLRAEKHSA